MPYLNNLHKEIVLQSALFDSNRIVEQLHWGGGTPTFINHDQMRELMAVTGQHFNLASDDKAEFSIEIDPREADEKTIALLREIGFNRLSLGVQDFNPIVQKAVNRIQSEAETFAVINAARANNFRSVSLDLIYGLPHQTPRSFSETLDKVINEASPDRLSVFNYAHMPERFKIQRQMNDDDMPPPEVKLGILHRSIDQLTSAGYVYIGMDHFAAAPHIVSKTDLIATVTDKLAETAKEQFNLVTRPHPVKLPTIQINCFWHRRFHQDAGNSWFRDLIFKEFSE